MVHYAGGKLRNDPSLIELVAKSLSWEKDGMKSLEGFCTSLI